MRVFLDGKQVVQEWGGAADGLRAKTAHVRLEQGKKVALKVEYSQRDLRPGRSAVDLGENMTPRRALTRLQRQETPTW